MHFHIEKLYQALGIVDEVQSRYLKFFERHNGFRYFTYIRKEQAVKQCHQDSEGKSFSTLSFTPLYPFSGHYWR